MKRFLLARELPAIFTVSLVGAVFAFENGRPAFGGWLLVAALWCFLLWLILLPLLPARSSARAKQTARAKVDQSQPGHNQQQRHCKRGHAA